MYHGLGSNYEPVVPDQQNCCKLMLQQQAPHEGSTAKPWCLLSSPPPRVQIDKLAVKLMRDNTQGQVLLAGFCCTLEVSTTPMHAGETGSVPAAVGAPYHASGRQ